MAPNDEHPEKSERVSVSRRDFLKTSLAATAACATFGALGNDAAKLRQGQTVLLRGANAPISEAAVLIRCDNQPIAIGEISQGFLKTKRLFNL